MADNMTPRLYHIYHTYFRHDYVVSAADKTPLFFTENSTWTPRKPDLTIHEGTDKKGAILATVKFAHFSRRSKVSLGDPADLRHTTWEDLIGKGICHSRFNWQMQVEKDGVPNRSSFVWKSTSRVGVGNTRPSRLSSNNYKLVDAQTGQVLAAFTNSGHKSLDKEGKLEIYPSYGRDFDMMVLATILSIVERQRRQSSGDGGGGDGGGGGGGGC